MLHSPRIAGIDALPLFPPRVLYFIATKNQYIVEVDTSGGDIHLAIPSSLLQPLPVFLVCLAMLICYLGSRLQTS